MAEEEDRLARDARIKSLIAAASVTPAEEGATAATLLPIAELLTDIRDELRTFNRRARWTG